jgi:hypothetical protein
VPLASCNGRALDFRHRNNGEFMVGPWTTFFLAFCGLALAGCAQPYVIQAQFDPKLVEWSRQTGTATIRGQGFMRTRGGEVRTCAGQPAFLTPRSPYSDETHLFLSQPHMGRAPVQNTSPLASGFARSATCDAQGNFVFRDLPAGEWYVRVNVTWEVPISAYSTALQGGTLSRPVTTRPGQTEELIVSR